MFDKLRLKVVYDDFLSKTKLTDEQIRILDMLIAKESIVKISMEVNRSERGVNYQIKSIKEIFNNYITLEKSKLDVLLK